MDARTESRRAEREALRCANCRITLRAERVVAGGADYCCEGCAAGGPEDVRIVVDFRAAL